MKLLNDVEGSKYIKEGADFVNNTKAPFSSARSTAKLAIAEYLANKDGFTLYESVANFYMEEE